MLTVVKRAVVHSSLVAVAVGATLLGAAIPAAAQQAPDQASETGQSTPTTVLSDCDNGTRSVKVVLDDKNAPYTLRLTGSDKPEQTIERTTEPDKDDPAAATATFDKVPAGEYEVEIAGSRDWLTSVPISVKCDSGNKSPGLGTYALCDTKADINSLPALYVEIDNPNGKPVDYTVTANGITKTATVAAGSHGSVNMGGTPGGDYKVVVDGSDGTQAVTGVSVDYCQDVKVDRDKGFQVSTRCVDEQSVVTFRYYAVGPYPADRVLTIDGMPSFKETAHFDGDGVYQWTRHTGEFPDGSYTAHLSGLNSAVTFTVACERRSEPSTGQTQPSNPDTTRATTTTAPTSSSTAASLPVSTSPAPPVAQGGTGPDGSLPVTGVAVGGLVLLGLLALAGGTVLLIVQRRRRSA
ncbi:hypothetical protein [Actinokineospora inagensis]|uniref:hypothetical protein n=1 Tax=Actinokineospora inagensis TaxID=103730 RepID=UPI00041BD5B5|nr:hypothetical protein [Actinokineospora inagensis]